MCNPEKHTNTLYIHMLDNELCFRRMITYTIESGTKFDDMEIGYDGRLYLKFNTADDKTYLLVYN